MSIKHYSAEREIMVLIISKPDIWIRITLIYNNILQKRYVLIYHKNIILLSSVIIEKYIWNCLFLIFIYIFSSFIFLIYILNILEV